MSSNEDSPPSEEGSLVCEVMKSLLKEDFVESEEMMCISTLGVGFPARLFTFGAGQVPEYEWGVVVGHGLAMSGHDGDDWTAIVGKGLSLIPINPPNALFYTARGHGASVGWQETARDDIEQFQWPRLAGDMLEMGNTRGIRNLIVGGESMGSATAFFAALSDPERVKAVIMVRPPTAWETRAGQREKLERLADQLQLKNKPSTQFSPLFPWVLRGTARCDFPPREDADTYSRIKCPVLILASRNDDVHPVSTSTYLASLLPNAELHIADGLQDAVEAWPRIIADFVQRVMQ